MLIATLVVATLAIGWAIAWRAAIRIPPEPDEAELRADGARTFRRPSDGARLEYFERGPDDGAVVVLIHGASSTGRIAALVEAEALDGIRILAPSLPGFGATAPYESWDGSRCLSTFAGDLLALLDERGVSTFSVVGLSTGAFFALRVAQAAGPARVRRAATVAGAVWTQPSGHHWLDGSELGVLQQAFLRLAAVEAVAFPVGTWLMRPLHRDPVRVRRAMAAEIEPFAAAHPACAAASVEEIPRSVRYYAHGLVCAQLWLGARPRSPQVDWARLATLPVDVHVPAEDRVISPANPRYLLAMLPQAQRFPLPGGHMAIHAHLGAVVRAVVRPALGTSGDPQEGCRPPPPR